MPLNQGTLAAVVDWLALRGDAPGPLLLAMTQHGKMTAEGVSADALLRRCKALAERAGLTEFSPHDLRRTHVSGLLEAGADMSDVSKLVAEREGYDLMPEMGYKPTNKYLPPRPRRRGDGETPGEIPETSRRAQTPGSAMDKLFAWADQKLSR